MSSLLQVVGTLFAFVGGLTLFVALFTPRRYTSKRPFRFMAGGGCLVLAVIFFAIAAEPQEDVAPVNPQVEISPEN